MKKRTGPHPISVHLGMAAASAAGVNLYASKFTRSYSEAELVAMMRGIKLYQMSAHVTQRPGLTKCWGCKSASLYSVHDYDAGLEPLIIVPSLVNRSYIFNLNAQRSFVAWAAQRGVAVYLLDWGDVTQGEGLGINEVLFEVITGAVKHVSEKHNAQKPNMLGYCVGGILTLGAAQAVSEDVGKIILLASPWDFHHPALELSSRVRSWSPFALASISDKGYLPEQWMQALFASLEPDASVQKFIKFANMEQGSEQAKLFTDVEDWLNDNVDISSDLAQHFLQKWFAENALVKNSWHLDGVHIDVSSITNEILIVASTGDHLVPYDCAMTVLNTLVSARCEVHRHECGHIGFIAGRNAVEAVWEPMLAWMQKK